jgi:glucose/arabinose dehydrogenase
MTPLKTSLLGLAGVVLAASVACAPAASPTATTPAVGVAPTAPASAPPAAAPASRSRGRSTLPQGFRANVFAAGLGGPRLPAIGPGGTIFATGMTGGQVYTLADRDGDGVAVTCSATTFRSRRFTASAMAAMPAGRSATQPLVVYGQTPSLDDPRAVRRSTRRP